MAESEDSRVIHLAQIQGVIPGPAGEHSITVLRRGALDVRLAVAPARPSPLTAHTQDEVYVVIRGRGVFVHAGERDRFEPGDLLFVAAGSEHRFEDVSGDLVVWVIFHGAQGGEVSD